MTSSLLFWVLLAVLVFWGVGAYNRLVRLRSAALQAYVTLDAALARQLEFVQARALAADDAVFGRGPIVQLHATALQLTTLLGATRQRPLDPERMAALATALHVMLAAWQRLFPDEVVSFDADGMLSRPVPLGGVVTDALPAPGPGAIAWPEPSAAAEIARGHFNQAVRQYNAAVGQIPAVLVAWVMQLRRAAELI